MKLSTVISVFFAVLLQTSQGFAAFSTPTKEDLNAGKYKQATTGYDQIESSVPSSFQAIIEHFASRPEKAMQLRFLATNLWGPSNSIDTPGVILTGSVAVAYWALKYGIDCREPNDIDLAVSSLFLSGGFYPTEFFQTDTIGRSAYSHIVKGQVGYFDTDFILYDSQLGFVQTKDLIRDPVSKNLIPVLPPVRLLETKLQKRNEQITLKAAPEKIAETNLDIEILETILERMSEQQQENLESTSQEDEPEFKQAPGSDQLPTARKLFF